MLARATEDTQEGTRTGLEVSAARREGWQSAAEAEVQKQIDELPARMATPCEQDGEAQYGSRAVGGETNRHKRPGGRR